MAENPKKRLTPWRRGDLPSASHLNEGIQAIERIVGGVVPPQQVFPDIPQAASISGRQYRVKSVQDDHLVCREWDGTVEGAGDVKVAKPFLLRKTPFDTLTRNGITFAYTSSTERTATEDSSGDIQNQIIVSSYQVDDLIYVIGNVAGGVDTQDENSVDLTRLDLNVDGRAWSRKFET